MPMEATSTSPASIASRLAEGLAGFIYRTETGWSGSIRSRSAASRKPFSRVI